MKSEPPGNWPSKRSSSRLPSWRRKEERRRDRSTFQFLFMTAVISIPQIPIWSCEFVYFHLAQNYGRARCGFPSIALNAQFVSTEKDNVSFPKKKFCGSVVYGWSELADVLQSGAWLLPSLFDRFSLTTLLIRKHFMNLNGATFDNQFAWSEDPLVFRLVLISRLWLGKIFILKFSPFIMKVVTFSI